MDHEQILAEIRQNYAKDLEIITGIPGYKAIAVEPSANLGPTVSISVHHGTDPAAFPNYLGPYPTVIKVEADIKGNT